MGLFVYHGGSNKVCEALCWKFWLRPAKAKKGQVLLKGHGLFDKI